LDESLPVTDNFGLNSEKLFTTCKPYFTLQGEDFVKEERRQIKEIMSKAEVPGTKYFQIMFFFEEIKFKNYH